MAIGLPVKANYAAGDILTATNMNDLSGTLNEVATNIGYGQAGKNKIINGDFGINQRNFTSNTTAVYNFDRWFQNNGGTTGTLTTTPQIFTLGSAPVAGYEAKNFVQMVTASGASTNTFAILCQRIESVRTFAGQTATVSFWARSTSGTPKIALEIEQIFGSGGSPSSVVATPIGAVTISTSWARYSLSIAVPSISGKTLGTNNDSSITLNTWLSSGSDYNTRSSNIGLQNNTFQLWGFQMEYGSTATPFQTASGGSLQGELAMCQRYFRSSYSQGVTVPTNTSSDGVVSFGVTSVLGNGTYGRVQFSPIMRVRPTITTYSYASSTVGVMSDFSTGANLSASTAASYGIGTDGFNIYNGSGGTAAGIYGFMCHYKAEAEL